MTFLTNTSSEYMRILSIEFAPLRVPLERRLQTLAAGSWFVTLAFGGLIGALFTLYLVLFTRFWWLTLLYLLWLYFDRNTSEQGGRKIEWVRDWAWWRYFRDYFPLSVKKSSDFQLDPKKNYLFCCFPHGMLSTGVFNAFGTNSSEFKELCPQHTTRVVTLHQHYIMPFFRDWALSLGGISATAKSIEYCLRKPEGGEVVILMPGGAAEAYFCHPRKYKILLKKRKGFIKLALRNGTPLVPVFSFGETDLFEQLEGATLRRVQEFLRRYIGLAPIVPLGRGFFQYSFGIIPQRRRVTTIIGEPIEIEKNPHPSIEQIDEMHAKFTEKLVELFETQKGNYIKDAENIKLEI